MKFNTALSALLVGSCAAFSPGPAGSPRASETVSSFHPRIVVVCLTCSDPLSV